MVISLVILLAGSLSIQSLPITLYPQITPPTVEVEVNYPGANAETVEQSIAAPIETEVNGAENLAHFARSAVKTWEHKGETKRNRAFFYHGNECPRA